MAATTQLTAIPKDANGVPLTGRKVTWESSDQAIAGIGGSGLVTGVSPGTATITAATEGRRGAAAITVMPAPAVRLVFTAQPASAAVGALFAPAVEVTAQDAQGNTATTFAGAVTVAIASNGGGGTLGGTTTITAVAGIATFPDLSIDKIGSGYTLAATSSALTAATSAAFDVTAGAATQLVFTVQPTNTPAGAVITPAVEVTARDAQGNPTTDFAGQVSIAIGTNPGGGTLSGTITGTAVDGVVRFSTLRINAAHDGYTLSATAAGLTAAVSAAFDIAPSTPSRLVFSAQPGNATAGVPMATIRVTTRDSLGNTVSSFTGAVTVTIGTGSGASGATLTGTTTAAAVSGVAAFSDLRIDRSGTGYTLNATAPNLTAATSAAFDIAAGAATQLVFAVEPSTAMAGTAITPPVEVDARDALGNRADSYSGVVTVALEDNPAGGTLLGTTTVAAASGIAVFADLGVDRVGTGYTLSAAASGPAGTTSAPFGIVSGQADRLVFTVQPTTTTSGTTIQPAVEVTARDSLGNTVTGYTGDVTLALTAGGGTLGAALFGTTTVSAVAGVATFSTLSIEPPGSGYELSATSPGMVGAISAPFDLIAGVATRLVFTRQPTTATAGIPFVPAVEVTAQDAQGNTATAFVGPVTVAIATNGGGGTLGGTTTATAVGGIATFPDLSIDKSGVGYTLAATSDPLTAATSAAFDVTTGAATQLVFSVQPVNTRAGAVITPAVVVTARDAQGNTATDFVGAVSVAIGTNPGGGKLSGTTTRTAVAGVATFSDLKIDKPGTGYVLTATTAGLGGAVSSAFDITATAVVLVGAGDIANCSSSGDEATANLLDGIAGTVFTAGDNAYPDGSATNYTQCYAPTWGRHKARTRPTPGNHEYTTPNAPGYFGYFGAAAGPAGLGYYSYDLGDWHMVALNSNISMAAGSPQEQWLRADLAASTKRCTLAYWHYPLFNSGPRGNSTSTRPLWQALYDAGGEIVINGHDHDYQRFAPMTPTGTLDNGRGIREFVVGTGGTGLYTFSTPIANTEAYNTNTHGVLKLTLSADGSNTYSWAFIPIAGQTFTDSGSGTCH